MVQLNPYLIFDNNAKEAMAFYQSVLGGELKSQLVSDSPMAVKMDKKFHGQVLHALLSGADFVLMASDALDKGPVKRGDAISLSLNFDNEPEIRRVFEALSAGGKVVMPLADMFWGGLYGMVVDKFGHSWMLNFQKTPMEGM